MYLLIKNNVHSHYVIHNGLPETGNFSLVKGDLQSIQRYGQSLYDEGIQGGHVEVGHPLYEIRDCILGGLHEARLRRIVTGIDEIR